MFIASRKLAKNGDGSTEGSCMQCDPTQDVCPVGCQALVNHLFQDCAGVCLPDGYFFDPKWQYDGCWKDHFEQVMIGVNRCGCNSAFSMLQSGSRLTFVVIVSVLVVVVQVLL